MTDSFHDPYRQSTALLSALASDKMRIAFLLGAGCPVSISVPDGENFKSLIPDIRGLTALVTSHLKGSEKYRDTFHAILDRFSPHDPTIEEILTHIRQLTEIMKAGDFNGLNLADLIDLDKEICDFTTTLVNVELPEFSTPYHQLAKWIGGIQRIHPIEVFTPNYDLLMEQALEFHKIPYFDGFVGSKSAFFDLNTMDMKDDKLPLRWGRLWKIHGSVNWWRTPDGDIVRKERPTAGDRQMIYPSHLKYDQSRRMPYLAMLDRLRSFLARGQAVLVTSGYSFSDQHLNEVIIDGLRSNPTAVCFGLLYGDRAGYNDAVEKARNRPNLSLLATDGAILGTRNRDWQKSGNANHPMRGLAVLEDEIEPGAVREILHCKFLLGDFKAFGNFLEQQLPQFDGEFVVDERA